VNILVFRINKEKYAPERLQEEARQLGCRLEIVQYQDLTFDFSFQKMTVSVNGHSLDDYQGAIFRVAGTRTGGYIAFRNLLIRYLLSQNKKVLNGRSYLRFPRLDKLTQAYHLVDQGLPVVKTVSFGANLSLAELKKLLKKEVGFPCLVKPRFGAQGRGIEKITSPEDLEKIYPLLTTKGLEMWLFQPFLPVGQDYRLIVLGGQVIGVMKRVAAPGSVVTNFSQGGQVLAIKPTAEQIQLAEAAASVFTLDYAGIDIIHDSSGKPCILEVNRACQFKGFESVTGINVARKLLEWLSGR